MGNNVQSLERALAIIEQLAHSREGLGISTISRDLSLPPSTVHRLVNTLAHLGYVSQVAGQRYRLSSKFATMCRGLQEDSELRQIVRPHLENICSQTKETANLVILDAHEAVYIDKVDSPRFLRVFSRIGHRAPLYCTAVGKILLADMNADAFDQYLGQIDLVPLTRHTISSHDALRNEIVTISMQGYALDLEECELGAQCVAVGVKGRDGRIVAAISVSGPAVRFDRNSMNEALQVLHESARKISWELGYRRSVAKAASMLD